MNYHKYSISDFAMDPEFRNWVQAPDQYPELDRSWQNWLQNHPEKLEEVEAAKKIILYFNFRNYTSPDEDQVKLAIDEAIEHYEKQKIATSAPKSGALYIHWAKIAASIMLLLLTGLGGYYYTVSKTIKYVTDYGETQKVILPDSSRVILNANSKISFNPDWQSVKNIKTREVKLEGEAFFEVEREENAENNPVKFIVHTDNLDVQVVGTQFNVHTRRGNTRVILNTGKVRLFFPQNEHSNKTRSRTRFNETEIFMEPGEMVEYSGQNKKVSKKGVDPEKYTAWRHNKFVFEEMTLAGIARRLEDYHGVDIMIEDSVLAGTQLTGTFPSQDLEMVLTALPTLVDMNVTREKEKIIFSE